MIFVASNQFGGQRGGGVPGGGFGCLLITILGFVATYFILKGLYNLLYLLSPVLLVMALVVNWRVFPNIAKNWLKTLETNPLSALITAGFCVLIFPFFSLYILLKALGMKKLEEMGQQMSGQQGNNTRNEDEFVEFEEIETTPKRDLKKEEPLVTPDLPEKETPAPRQQEPPKPQNPYDQLFD
ncbi:MAG: hypothetical protein IT262_21430 [Saprospiraceae bacterium]|nr:hypothetical protein [Saprospiraceae bacterium]